MLIALIAAGSAIAGTIVTQIVSVLLSYLDRKHQKKVLLREKYEELALLINESGEWLSNKMTAVTISELTLDGPEKARKATVLAHIYFPKLRDACECYVNTNVEFVNYLCDYYQDGSGLSMSVLAVKADEHGYQTTVNNVLNSRTTLEESIIKYASEYAKA